MSRFWVILLISIGVFVMLVFLGVIVAGIVYYSDFEALKNTNQVIRLDFSNGLPETRSNDPFTRLTSRGIVTLLEFDRALDHAATDDNVTGIVADLSFVNMGIAQLEDVRNAVLRFKESGKWTIAYADTYFSGSTGTGVYYLASVFDEVYMHRTGDVGFLGLAIQPFFFADAFEKLGIKTVMDQRHEFKTMVNMYTESGYTKPHREIEQRMLDQIMDRILTGVATDRNIDRDKLERLVDQAPFIGQEAIDAGLIDGFKYWDEVKQLMEEKAEGEISVTGLANYHEHNVDELEQSSENVIALVYGLGEVVRGEAQTTFQGNPVMAARTLSKAIRQIREDGDVDITVFRVSSPGGSHDASDTIAHEIKLTREAGIPVIVSMGDVAASGGYYVSMYADVIMAQPITITGSIGVAGGKFVINEFLERFGITTDDIHVGDHSMLLSMFHNPSESELARFAGMLDRIYTDFTTEVMESRNLSAEQIDNLARGRVWTGSDAVKNGLVDRLGGLHEAIELAREQAGFKLDDLVSIRIYPREKSFLELLKDTNQSYFTRLYQASITFVETMRLINDLGVANIRQILENERQTLKSSVNLAF
ncbi:signal peptide peptidase SppA [bacterium]|nr:signal peptide peptidase SppA [bacterium]